MPPFSVVRLGEAALVWAEGPLAATAAADLHDALEVLIAEGAAPLVVDLVRVPTVDKPVVAQLAAAASQSGHLGQSIDLRLAGNRRYIVRDAAHLRYAIALAYPAAA